MAFSSQEMRDDCIRLPDLPRTSGWSSHTRIRAEISRTVSICGLLGRLPGQTVFLCVLNGLLNHPTLTQRMLEEQYRKHIGRSCDHSSFGRRLACISTDYFQAIFEYLYKKLDSLVVKTDLKALRLRIIDATIVTLSAKLLDFGIKANHGNKGLKTQIRAVVELSDEGFW